ncbi:hypothetical protein BS50DRAFT_629843 [Corynespora cassiicola Philippines]|uniref:Uncharacterized protein n=1 Tax=Corynespora cassiicola Philippines TaxID=1448308 RepID=A0A2T2P1Z9_CORCC|nr:hypothetical protein BS50DRAFT_629843 [Corynespora cassiicola Philippines]
MKTIFAAAIGLLALSADASVVFSLASEPNGQGERKSWVVDRWTCKNLADDDFDKQASWAFVDAGLANGCTLYDEADCKGEQVWVEKNNSNVLGPGPVDLVNVDFDKKASAFQCF